MQAIVIIKICVHVQHCFHEHIFCKTTFHVNILFSGTSLFTATHGQTISGLNNIRFPNIIANIANDYNATSGKFTCRIPGEYWFSVSLVRSNGQAYGITCHILINETAKITFYTPNENGDHATASATAGFHLSRGDRVNIGQCSYGEHIFSGSETYFSGVLVTPDL